MNSTGTGNLRVLKSKFSPIATMVNLSPMVHAWGHSVSNTWLLGATKPSTRIYASSQRHLADKKKSQNLQVLTIF